MDLRTEKFKNYQFKDFQLSDQFSKKVISRIISITKGANGDIWFGTFTDAIFRYSSARDTFINYRYPQANVAPHFPIKQNIDHIRSIAQDRFNDSIVWAGTTAGLLKINSVTNNIKWYLYPKKEEKDFISQNAVRKFHQASDSLLYLSSWHAKANIFDPKKEVFYLLPIENNSEEEKKEAYGFLNTPVSFMVEKSKDELYIFTLKGLMTYNIKTKTSTRLQYNDLKNNKIFGLSFIDSQNRAWLSRSNGLYLFDPLQQQFIKHDFEQIKPENYSFASYFIASKNKPAITIIPRAGDGVYTLDYKNNQWSKTQIPSKHFTDKKSFVTLNYIEAPNGNITISSRYGLYDYNPIKKTFKEIPLPKKFQEKLFRGLCWDHTGKLWIGLPIDGLIRWNPKNNEWKTFKGELQEIPRKASVGIISHILEDRQKNIWIKRQGGYSVYDSKRDTFFNFVNQNNSENSISIVHNFVEDNADRIWINSSSASIAYAKSTSFEEGIVQIFDLHGIQGIKNISFLRSDSEGVLWGIHEDQLLQITPSADSFSLDIHSLKYGVKEYDEIFGLEILPDGKMVIGGRDKVWIGDPNEFISNPEKPKPYITNISVLQVPLNSNIPPHLITHLDLTYAENFFSFDFSTIGFSQGHDNKFRYRLINFEDKWTTTDKRKFANFTNVPPGEYIFELQAANNEGVWNENTLRLPVNIAAPWWRTIWFWTIFTLGLIGIGYLFYTWRIEQVRREERLRSSYEKQLADVKLSALRAQMNPHFIFNSLNSIEYYIMKNEQEKAVDYLGRFSRLIRLILQNSKNQSIPLNDELEALKIYMEMESIRFDNLFEYEVKTEKGLLEENISIPPMLIQPYVENAIWHGLRQKKGGQGKIKLYLSKNNDHLTCSIEDNGIGREAAQKLKSKSAEKRKSYGMKITSDRLEMLNNLGTSKAHIEVIDLKNEQGQATGTKIILTIPL